MSAPWDEGWALREVCALYSLVAPRATSVDLDSDAASIGTQVVLICIIMKSIALMGVPAISDDA